VSQYKKVRSFPRTVAYDVPHETKPNQFVRRTFDARFQQFSNSDLGRIQESLNGDADFLSHIIEDGSLKNIPVPGAEEPTHSEQLAVLQEDVVMLSAAINDYFNALKGDPARGNSKRSPAR
jgi:hypothetical protein